MQFKIRKVSPGDENNLAFIQTTSWKSALDKVKFSFGAAEICYTKYIAEKILGI